MSVTELSPIWQMLPSLRGELAWWLVPVAGAIWRWRSQGRLEDLMWVGLGSLMMTHAHHLYEVLPLFSVPAAGLLASLRGPAFQRMAVPAAAVVGLLALRSLLVAGGLAWPPDRLIRRETQPEGAAAFLARHADSRPRPVFNDMDWGGYLIWALNGQVQVFVDSRLNLIFTAAHFHEYADIMAGKGDLLLSRGIGTVVLASGQSPELVRDLLERLHWRMAFDDGISCVISQDLSPEAVPGDPWLAYQEGLRLLGGGDPRGAASQFSSALALYPDGARIRLNLGVALAQLGQFEGAAQQWRRCLFIQSRTRLANLNLALLALQQQRPVEAAARLHAELALDPGNAEARLRLEALGFQLWWPEAFWIWFSDQLG